MKKTASLVFTILMFLAVFGNTLVAQAVPAAPKCPEGSICLTNPLANDKGQDVTDASVIIGTIIRAALGVIGAVTLLMFVLGAQKWLTSAGNTEKVTEGAKTMLWAALGTLVVFASYIGVSNIIKLITGNK